MKHIVLITFLFLVGLINAQSKKEQIEILNKRVDSLNEVVGSERKINLDKSNKISELTNTITNLESSISSLNANVSKLTSELQQTKTESATKTQDLAKLQAQLKTKTDSLDLVLGELEKLKPAPKPVVSNNTNLTNNQVIQTGSLKSVKIGTQIWTAENLNVSTFRNGETIPEARNYEELDEYDKNKQPAWCYYNFDKNNGLKYGKLYNAFAVKDPRGLAPEGWHIPVDHEWCQLGFELGFAQAGKKLKSQSGWNNWESGGDDIRCNNCENASKEYKKICPSCKGTGYKGKTAKIKKNGNGTDSYKFSSKPSGYVLTDKFYSIGEIAHYWTSEFTNDGLLKTRVIDGDDGLKYDNAIDGDYHAIRLVKDYTINYNSIIDKRNNKNYKTNVINSKTWICENIDVSTFRNGDPIPEANTEEEWQKAGEEKRPMSCYYDFDKSNGEKYGKLYNWYAANDPRGLAPDGYHIPSDEEWEGLTKLLGENSGVKMKTTSGWKSFGSGSNESGFSGLPAGWATSDGTFEKIEYATAWWSSNDSFDATKWGRGLTFDWFTCWKWGKESKRSEGASVRCVKD
jgi:uncharacterized protein (TIGR02145 family)